MESAESAEKHKIHRLKVAKVIDETHDAKSIVFEIPEALRALFKYRAGQFLTLEIPWQGVTLRRCYSLASSPQCDAEHKVTVKRIADGRASNWLNDNLRAGDEIAVLAPEGRFVLTGTERPLVLFAGGSGITPVISLLKTALKTTQRTTRLVYANRDARSIIFQRELEALVATYGARVSIVHRLDDRDGFVTAAHVAGLIEGFRDGEFYMCGPGPFMDAIEQGLAAAGVDSARVHVERFVSLADPKPADAAAAPAPAPGPVGGVPDSLDVTVNSQRRDVPYKAGKTILRATLDAGFDAPYSCEEGFCGLCVAQLVEGEVKMDADDALTKDEKKRGLILTCQARPLTKRCVVKYLDT